MNPKVRVKDHAREALGQAKRSPVAQTSVKALIAGPLAAMSQKRARQSHLSVTGQIYRVRKSSANGTWGVIHGNTKGAASPRIVGISCPIRGEASGSDRRRPPRVPFLGF